MRNNHVSALPSEAVVRGITNKMRAMLTKYCHYLEKFLYAKGCKHPDVRQLILWQLYIMLLSVPFALLFLPLTKWGLFFSAGSWLAGANLWGTAKLATSLLQQKFTSGAALIQIASFYARLAFTGLVLYCLIVLMDAPLLPLLTGISTVISVIVVWGVSRYTTHKVKEA